MSVASELVSEGYSVLKLMTAFESIANSEVTRTIEEPVVEVLPRQPPRTEEVINDDSKSPLELRRINLLPEKINPRIR